MTRVVRDGVELAVFEEGDATGPTVVLVHGWPDTHAVWDRVAPLLAADCRVVRYDARGAGASSAVTGMAGMRIEELAADFRAVIDAVSPDAPVHVLAHDWGAVALWEAAAQPWADDRIASLTSISGPHFDLLGLWFRTRLRRRTRRDLAQVGGQCLASFYTVVFHIPVLPGLVLRSVGPRIWPRFLRLFDGLDPATVATGPTLGADMARGTWLYRANIIRRLRRPDPRPIRVPTQLLLNLRDRAVRPYIYDDYGDYVERLAVHRLPSGHWSPFSHPAEIADYTRDLIGAAG